MKIELASMEPKRVTDVKLLAVQQELICREPLFHRPELGISRDVFESMVSDDFWETGASGKRYSREYVIEVVTRRYAGDYQDEWRTDEFYCQEISTNHYLLTYTLYQSERITRRATLWRYSNGHWVAMYHQGTVVEAPSTPTEAN